MVTKADFLSLWGRNARFLLSWVSLDLNRRHNQNLPHNSKLHRQFHCPTVVRRGNDTSAFLNQTLEEYNLCFYLIPFSACNVIPRRLNTSSLLFGDFMSKILWSHVFVNIWFSLHAQNWVEILMFLYLRVSLFKSKSIFTRMKKRKGWEV